MTSPEAHKESVRILVEDVKEKLRSETAVHRQKLIGFACSEASCDLLAILLHKKNLIDPGFNVNHRFFVSTKIAASKFDYDFPSKRKLLLLLVNQEEYKNQLCYGKPKEKGVVLKCIENFFEIKKIIEKEVGEEI
ncbi:MAG: hypothetical protein J4473_04120 [Candidatus Aenigmarchaeota archaeon]|nr:hypothetical protein [Candidatus Aenigmarchaeota archaeon]